jgi:hypothetical protein
MWPGLKGCHRAVACPETRNPFVRRSDHGFRVARRFALRPLNPGYEVRAINGASRPYVRRRTVVARPDRCAIRWSKHCGSKFAPGRFCPGQCRHRERTDASRRQ